MNSESLLVFGAAGHAKSVIDLLHAHGSYSVIGVVEDTRERGSAFMGYPVLGGQDDLPALAAAHDCNRHFVAVGNIPGGVVAYGVPCRPVLARAADEVYL